MNDFWQHSRLTVGKILSRTKPPANNGNNRKESRAVAAIVTVLMEIKRMNCSLAKSYIID